MKKALIKLTKAISAVVPVTFTAMFFYFMVGPLLCSGQSDCSIPILPLVGSVLIALSASGLMWLLWYAVVSARSRPEEPFLSDTTPVGTENLNVAALAASASAASTAASAAGASGSSGCGGGC